MGAEAHLIDHPALEAEVRDVGGAWVRVLLRDPSAEWAVDFDGPCIGARGDDDFLVPLTLLPAMAQDLDLVLPAVRSAMLRGSLPRLQETYAAWFPGFRRTTITTGDARGPAPADRGRKRSIALFSGGVDSFYTVLTERARIDALLFVSGFDLCLGRLEEPDEDQVLSRLGAAAARLGLPLLHIRTSLRRYTDRWLRWGDHYVGSGLATVALLLADAFDEFIIPSTHTAPVGFPYGTHPETDPLWSTERIRLRVHGDDTPRPAKVAEISRSGIALDTLRVCWENPAGAYNCGRCEKCQRTMAELYLAGALTYCATLPDVIDLKALATLPVQDASRRSFAMSLRRAAQASEQPLARAIQAALGSALGLQ